MSRRRFPRLGGLVMSLLGGMAIAVEASPQWDTLCYWVAPQANSLEVGLYVFTSVDSGGHGIYTMTNYTGVENAPFIEKQATNWVLANGVGGYTDTQLGTGDEPTGSDATTIQRYSVETVASGRPGGSIAATREPINTVNGAMFMDEDDIVLRASGFDLRWRRTYNSMNTTVDGPLGPGWSHNYDWRVAETTLAVVVLGSTITHSGMVLKRGGDDAVSLVRDGTNRTWNSTRGALRTVTGTSEGYILNLPDGVTCRFGTNGVMANAMDRWGNGLTFAYTNIPGGPQVVEIAHSDGRSLRFGYTSNRLTRVDSPSTNLYVLYAYNSAGELTNAVRCTPSEGFSTAYAYDTTGTNRQHCLTTRINAKGEAVTYLYQTNASGEATSVCIGMAMTSNYYEHAIAFNPTGSVTAVTYARDAADVVYTYGYNAAADSRCVTQVGGPGNTGVIHRLDYDSRTALPTNEQWEARRQYTVATWGTFGSDPGDLDRPRGICVDQQHRLCVSDTFNDRIQRYDPVTATWTAWGQYGTNTGSFNKPQGIAVDSQGNIFVADANNGRVQKHTESNGQWSVVASYGTNVWQVRCPFDVTLDASDNLYVVDGTLNRVQRRAATNGTWSILVQSGTSNGTVHTPWSIELGDTNTMYVSDNGSANSNGYRVQKFLRDGTWVDTLGTGAATNGGFTNPMGMALVGDTLYVSDPGNDRVRYGGKGDWTTLVASNTVSEPSDLAWDPSGVLYIADTEHHRIFGLPILPGATAGTNGQATVTWYGQELEWVSVRSMYDEGLRLTNAAIGYGPPSSNAWQFTWNTNWDVLASVTDPEAHREEWDYTNAAVSAVRIFPATNQPVETAFVYTTNGLLAAVTNANGHWVQYQRDIYGYPTSTIPQAGPTNWMVWDSLGHLREIRLPSAEYTTNEPSEMVPRVISFDPDELGRVRKITWPDGTCETFGFDAIGNVTNHVDALGRSTRYTWLPTRRLASTTRMLNAQAATVGLDYDQQMNVGKVRDELGRSVETCQLDLQDRPVQVVNVSSQQMAIVWGLADFAQSVMRFDGTINTFSYDTGGRLSRVTYPDQTVTYVYLKNGLMRTASNQWGVVSNAYDGANRLVGQVTPVPNGALSYALYPAGQVSNIVSVAGTNTYMLDAAERLTTLTAARTGLASEAFQYGYDAVNGLVGTVAYSNGLTCSALYDKLDRLTSLVWKDASNVVVRSRAYAHNAVGSITNVVNETGEQVGYVFDDLDRLTRETHVNAAGQTVSDETYGYDLAGNRTNKTVWSGTTPLMTVNYTLGAGNRLASWSVAETDLVGRVDVAGVSGEPIGTNDRFGWLYVSNLNGRASVKPEAAGTNFWAYDLVVNLGTQKIVAAIRDAAGNTTHVTNQICLTVVTNGTYQYSAAGCVTNTAYCGTDYALTRGLAWDGQYQLTAVTTNGTMAERYGHDALGRRIWTWDAASGTNWLVYDGAQVVAETDAAGNLRKSYVYGPGIDNALSMTVYGAATNTYYYLKDHLGSVLALVDAAGQVVEQYRYDAWGRTTVSDANGNTLAASAVGNRYGWQGREYSWKTGLYYFRARWYDPITGRWLSNDPIGISGGLNQYVFCSNNPVNFSDPFGLDVWVASRGLHQSINIGNPSGTFSSYSLMDVPAFTVFGVPIFSDPFNPWNNGGVIYRDYEPGKPDMSRYLHSSPSEDARATQIIDMMVGDHLPYRLIGSTCRSFSADMFDFFKDDMHIGGADKNGDPCK